MTPIQISYRLNKQQAGAAVQLAGQRLRKAAGWRRILFWMQILGMLLAFFLPALLNIKGALILVWVASALMLVLGCLLYQSWWYEKYANYIGECQLTLDDDGVLIHIASVESRYPWAAVQELSVQPGGLAIVLGDIQSVMFVPDSAFVDAETRPAFLAAMREHGVVVPDVVPTEPVVPVAETPSSNFASDLAQLGRILTFRAPHAGTLTPDAWKFIVLTLLFGVFCFGVQIWKYGFSGGVAYWFGVLALLEPLALVALIAGLARWVGGKEVNGARLWQALTLLVLLLPFVDAWQGWMWWMWGRKLRWLEWIPAIWVTVAGTVQVRRLAVLTHPVRLAGALLLTYGCLAWLFLCFSIPILWYVPEEDDEADYQEQYLRIDERVLYEQPRLLAAALDKVQAGKAGEPEIFFLGVGGHRQGVFMREVLSVEKLFAERFGTAGHSLTLVNNKDTVDSLPTANLASLRQSLARMGEQMNEEDTLFLFLTSHGAPVHRFIFDLWPFSFTDLTPEALRQALDDAHIKRRVVVSSCYSGGFIPALQDANTLVITAAAADRTSFGCNVENGFTEFGRAYFDEALRQTHSFTRAFAIASKRIAEREKANGLTPSLPQMKGGEGLQLDED